LPASQPQTANTNYEDHLFFEAIERRRTQALVERDINTINALHPENYQLITPSGKAFTKSEYIAAVTEAPFYTSWKIEDFKCRPSSDMAAVRYKATLGFPSGNFLTCWHTDLNENRSGSWVAVWSQATELTQP
jgi:hypothetical protein